METTDLAEPPILVDTSVWIAYFRKEESAPPMNELIDSGRVCSTNLIVAELIQGAKSDKEIRVLKDFLDVFPFLREQEETWFKAAYMAYQLRKKGKTMGLADCYLAQIAIENKVGLYSFDKHFKVIGKMVPLQLVRLK